MRIQKKRIELFSLHDIYDRLEPFDRKQEALGVLDREKLDIKYRCCLTCNYILNILAVPPLDKFPRGRHQMQIIEDFNGERMI